MGYRSDVLIAAGFETKRDMDEVLAVFRLHPHVQKHKLLDTFTFVEAQDSGGLWVMYYYGEGIKWYSGYEDVAGYSHLFTLIADFADERGMICGYTFLRIGEEPTDIEEDVYDADPAGAVLCTLADMFSIHRSIHIAH